MQCLKCQSNRVATGAIKGSHSGHSIFAPSGLRFATLSLDHGIPLSSFACLDCGFVWSAADPKDLEAFIQKHCDQSVEKTGDYNQS